MTNNTYEIESFNKILADAEKAFLDAIEKYKENGFVNEEGRSTDKNIKLTRAILVDPTTQDVNVTRISISPNEEYNFNYFVDALEFLDNPYENTPPFYTSVSHLKTKFDSKELTKTERKQIMESSSYKAMCSVNQLGSN